LEKKVVVVVVGCGLPLCRYTCRVDIFINRVRVCLSVASISFLPLSQVLVSIEDKSPRWWYVWCSSCGLPEKKKKLWGGVLLARQQ
jgi:hypothetical protein